LEALKVEARSLEFRFENRATFHNVPFRDISCSPCSSGPRAPETESAPWPPPTPADRDAASKAASRVGVAALAGAQLAATPRDRRSVRSAPSDVGSAFLVCATSKQVSGLPGDFPFQRADFDVDEARGERWPTLGVGPAREVPPILQRPVEAHDFLAPCFDLRANACRLASRGRRCGAVVVRRRGDHVSHFHEARFRSCSS